MTKKGPSIVQAARSLKGKVKYCHGEKDPGNGVLDCSGFVRWAYGQAGVSIRDGTFRQWADTREIKKEELLVGDLGFLRDHWRTTNHVGIYCGNGIWIHCNASRNGVTEEKTNLFKYFRRFPALEAEKGEAVGKIPVWLEKDGKEAVDFLALHGVLNSPEHHKKDLSDPVTKAFLFVVLAKTIKIIKGGPNA